MDRKTRARGTTAALPAYPKRPGLARRIVEANQQCLKWNTSDEQHNSTRLKNVELPQTCLPALGAGTRSTQRSLRPKRREKATIPEA